jgi:hypothetical protein
MFQWEQKEEETGEKKEREKGNDEGKRKETVGLELKGEGMGIDPTKQSVNRRESGREREEEEKNVGCWECFGEDEPEKERRIK